MDIANKLDERPFTQLPKGQQDQLTASVSSLCHANRLGVIPRSILRKRLRTFCNNRRNFRKLKGNQDKYDARRKKQKAYRENKVPLLLVPGRRCAADSVL